jgi:AcrR family transcriptional regulator
MEGTPQRRAAREPERARRIPAAERRELLLNAADEEFAERGYAGARLVDVAARAGVTKSLVYRHFDSKAELYVGLLESRAAEVIAEVSAAVRKAGSTEQRFRAGVEAFFAALDRRPFSRRLLFRDPEADPDVAAAYDRVHAAAADALARALAADKSMLRGDPDRAQALELLAYVLKTTLNGLAGWWFANPDVPRETLVERAMQMMWPGVEQLRTEPAR